MYDINIFVFMFSELPVLNMDGDCGSTAEEEKQKISLHLNVDETPGGCGGSDSGVDVTPAVSCDSSLASGCYDPCKSPLGPFSPTDSNGPSSLPCYPVINLSRPITPTAWRRTNASDRTVKPQSNYSMSSSFHFETSRNSPPRTELKKPDLNSVAKQAKISTVKKLVNSYDMAKSLDKFATLPRRKRKSKENLVVVGTLSPSSTTKEPSLNRAASLRRKHIEQGAQNTASTSLLSSPITKPALPKPTKVTRTKIYHEICSQTYLTGEDITKVLSGNVLPPIENRVETNDAEIQVIHKFIIFLIILNVLKKNL